MDPNRVCPNCLREMPQKGGKCPFCGYEEGTQELSARCLPPYTVLQGRYFIGTVIGEGGFGITYRGWDLVDNRKVAIKEYFPTGLVTRDTSHGGDNTVQSISGQMREQYQSGLQKYENEAKCLMRLRGLPGIVNILDFFHENSTAYIVMEFLEGMTMREYLVRNQGCLPEKKALEMMKPLMYSLDSIHRAGIVHRDISPDNIIVQPDGKLKLIDFGAARQSTGNQTQSLTVVLKHGYAPEEQYRSRGRQGPFTDVYAISATLYKILTGVTPVDSMSRMFEDELKPLHQFPNKISSQTCVAIAKGMEVRASERFQSISELAAALYEKKPVVLSGGTSIRKENKSRRMIAWILGGAAAFAVLIGSVLLMTQPLTQNDSRGLSELENTTVAADEPIDSQESTETPAPVVSADPTGMLEKDAKSKLEADGFTVGVKYTPSDSAHAGKVLSWEKTSGTSVELHIGELTEFSFDEQNGEVTITGYNGDKTVLSVPETINELPVAAIGENAFSEDGIGANGLQQITLPEGLRTIGVGAFSNCIYLTSVKLPSTITDIRESAFWSCSAMELSSLPQSLETVGDYAFQYCYNLKAIDLPDGCRTVGEEAFEGCLGVRQITLPASLTEIGSGAFTGCPNASVRVTAGSYAEEYMSRGDMEYTYQDGDPAVEEPTLSKSPDTGTKAVPNVVGQNQTNAQNTLKDNGFAVAVSETYSDTVTSGNVISQTPAAESSQAKGATVSIVVSKGKNEVEKLSVNSFPTQMSYTAGDTLSTAGLSLTATYSDGSTQVIDSGITCSPTTLNTAGTQAVTVTYEGKTTSFNVTVSAPIVSGKCETNAKWQLVGGVLTISGTGEVSSAPWCDEYNAKIEKIVFESGITRVEYNVFAFGRYGRLIEVVIPDTVDFFAENSFASTYSLQKYTVSEKNQTYTSVDGVLFTKDKKALIRYPAGKTTNEYTVPYGTERIGFDAFCPAPDIKIILPDTLKRIEVMAFHRAKAKGIRIPKSVEYIGEAAFYGWTSEQTIYIEGRSEAPDSWDPNWNEDCDATIIWEG